MSEKLVLLYFVFVIVYILIGAIVLFKNKHSKMFPILFLIFISFLGFILRVAACFLGYPYVIHPDEKYIVERTKDMIMRNSWEADVYNWPGHFSIKFDAILFTIGSYIKYGTGVVAAWEDEHEIFFYFIARIFSSVCGTIMIPLAYMICEKIKKKSGYIAAILIACFPVLIVHSGYATCDIPIAMLEMLGIYLAMQYLEKGNSKWRYALCVVVGAAVTCKYPGAFLSILVIYVVIADALKNKSIKTFFIEGIQGIAIAFATLFVIAPNLVTNFQKLIEIFSEESNDVHRGQNGLGYFGNLKYYLSVIADNSGYIAILFAVVGFVWVFYKKKRNIYPIFVGIIYILILSVLDLHWERWGTPFYASIIMLMAVGILWLLEYDRIKKNEGKKHYKYIEIVVCILVVLIFANTITAGIRNSLEELAQENRVKALAYCKDNDITTDNTAYDGYSPLLMQSPNKIKVSVDEEGKIVVKDNIKYMITSSYMYDGYYAEAEKYADILQRYIAIEKYGILLKEWKEYDKNSKFACVNTLYNAKEIFEIINGGDVGTTIRIYKVPNE